EEGDPPARLVHQHHPNHTARRAPRRLERLVTLHRRPAVRLERPGRPPPPPPGRFASEIRPSPYFRGRPGFPVPGAGTVRSAASLPNRLTTTPPRAARGLSNAAFAYAPSATTHTGLPRNPSRARAHRTSPAASSGLVRNAGRCLGSMPARSFRRT